ncbi:MAG: TIGR02452 family protein [Flavobacteriaceae bacterium]|nr:TIGR02452 family protein [Flavobacteriaceae bacterium]
MQKSLRKIAAKETLEIMNKGFYVTDEGYKVSIKKEQAFTEDSAKYFSSEELEDLLNSLQITKQFDTEIEVTNESTLEAIQRLHQEEVEDAMTLNFASAKNPGGGFLNGAQAQEESVARSSGLYHTQMNNYEFYERHRGMKSCVYTDSMIYSPKVPFFRNVKGKLLAEPILSSVITSAAVNAGVVKRKESKNAKRIEEFMDMRIDKLLAMSYEQEHEVLILGAWGCGVFQNDPEIIARLFKEQLKGKYKNAFKRVVFAIYSRNEKFINAFKKELE